MTQSFSEDDAADDENDDDDDDDDDDDNDDDKRPTIHGSCQHIGAPPPPYPVDNAMVSLILNNWIVICCIWWIALSREKQPENK